MLEGTIDAPVLVNKKKNCRMIIDVAILVDVRLQDNDIRVCGARLLAIGKWEKFGWSLLWLVLEVWEKIWNVCSQSRHWEKCSLNVETYSISKIRIVKESTRDYRNYEKLLGTKGEGDSLGSQALSYLLWRT